MSSSLAKRKNLSKNELINRPVFIRPNGEKGFIKVIGFFKHLIITKKGQSWYKHETLLIKEDDKPNS